MAKVCIIGTEAATHSTFQSILEENGHAVESWGIDNHVDVDVAILDIGNRATTEVSALTLQARHQFPNVPLLVVVDDRAAFRAIDALRLGASHYVVKSALKTDLSAFVDLVLSMQNIGEGKTLFQDYPTLEELEKRYMKIVLEKTLGRKERAAKILGINRRTLYRKEREYGWVSADDDSESMVVEREV